MTSVKTKVVHSESKTAWNVVGETWGGKYKIARVPYHICNNEKLDTRSKAEALEYAEFISKAFNVEARGY